MASKYEKGERITSLDVLYSQDFIWLRYKVYNYGWFKNWQLRRANLWICQGIVYKAIPKTKKEKDNG